MLHAVILRIASELPIWEDFGIGDFVLLEYLPFFSMQGGPAYEGGMVDLRMVPCLNSRVNGELGDIGNYSAISC
jgi:hypothetical protein